MVRKLILALSILFILGNVSFAVMCARLKSVSAGEDHTLALAEDNTLWACGSNYEWQLGFGRGVPHAYSLQKLWEAIHIEKILQFMSRLWYNTC